jgi:hypothetical protein
MDLPTIVSLSPSTVIFMKHAYLRWLLNPCTFLVLNVTGRTLILAVLWGRGAPVVVPRRKRQPWYAIGSLHASRQLGSDTCRERLRSVVFPGSEQSDSSPPPSLHCVSSGTRRNKGDGATPQDRCATLLPTRDRNTDNSEVARGY